MPKVTIDGTQAEFEDGLTVIRAAERLGIEIPHYCWHPGLSIAGNCRMCLVEIEKVPKLQIACNTRVTEGMVVHTRNERVKKAQRAVLEFLLINHPIDCPICDQAGECKLQEYYMDYDRQQSRFPVEEKVHKRKTVDLGPTVVLDQERCILCLRCTRFLDEVSRTSELGVFERGDRAFIDLAPGKILDNPYSGNVVDICPVGALTSKDFRFKARVWYLQRTESICTFCATGCNIEIHHREGKIYRFRPRYNSEVNDYWMCDFGRMGYKRIQGEDRRLRPQMRVDGELRDVTWPEAMTVLTSRLSSARQSGEAVAGIISATASNEEAFLFRRLLTEALTSTRLAGHAWSPAGAYHDDKLIRADKNPNRRGLESLGISTDASVVDGILEDSRSGRIRTLVIFGADLTADLGTDRTEAALDAVDFVVVLGLRRSEMDLHADLSLPIASFAEMDGTFTNFAGRVQRAWQAFPPPGEARPGWSVLCDLLAGLGCGMTLQSAGEVFAEIGRRVPQFGQFSYERLSNRGAVLPGA